MPFQIFDYNSGSDRSRIIGSTPVILNNFFHLVDLNLNDNGLVDLSGKTFLLKERVKEWLETYVKADECYIEYWYKRPKLSYGHPTLGFYFRDPKIALLFKLSWA